MYYGKGFNDGEDETFEQQLIKRIERSLKEKEDYDGANLRVIGETNKENEIKNNDWGDE